MRGRMVLAIALSCAIAGCAGSNPGKTTIGQVKARHEESLLSVEGVTGVGVGELEGKPCLTVYLVDDSVKERLPGELDGYPVKTEVTGRIAPLPEESMKGYELYSWKSGDTWLFSLLAGTNREKSKEEITSADTAVEGTGAIEALLGSLRRGQSVLWLASGEEATLPPPEVVEEIRGFCEDAGVTLAVTAP